MYTKKFKLISKLNHKTKAKFQVAHIETEWIFQLRSDFVQLGRGSDHGPAVEAGCQVALERGRGPVAVVGRQLAEVVHVPGAQHRRRCLQYFHRFVAVRQLSACYDLIN